MGRTSFRVLLGLMAVMWVCVPSYGQGQRALVNMSVLTSVTSSSGVVGSAFTIEGTTSKTVLIRGVGPALNLFGVSGLSDPVLRVFDGTGAVVASNSGWGNNQALTSAFVSVGAFLFPTNSNDAALLLTLNPGTYSATVTSASGKTGVALLEIYETNTTPRFAYLAARTQVPANAPAASMSVGFVVGGSSPATFLIRALGPALTTAGVTNALFNPTLTLFSAGTPIASNDNWGGATSLSDAAVTAGLMPLASGSNDSALLVTLSPGNYTAQVSGVGGATGMTMVEVAQIDANRATSSVPALLIPPQDVTAPVGAAVTLAAPANGRPAPSYQWRKDGTPIPGATRSSYTIGATFVSLQPSDVGSYTVVMSNSAGVTTSAPFAVNVLTAVSITTQPVGQTVTAGQTATFTVAATGFPAPTYQWLRNGVALPGATQATLTLANVTTSQGGTYSVQASNSSGTVISNAVPLAVNAPGLALTTPPLSQTVNSGDAVTFTVVVAGEPPLRYQWLYNGAILGGATNATLTLDPVLISRAGNYAVTVSNASGSLTSDSAVLTVRPRPLEGAYLGTFISNSVGLGSFALLVRADGTGAFLGWIQSTGQALVARELRLGTDRRFDFPVTTFGGTGAAEYHLNGAISPDGKLNGIVSEISLGMDAPAPRTPLTTPNAAGFYQGGATGGAAAAYLIASAGGEVYAITWSGATIDFGIGTVSASGDFSLTTNAIARITGTLRNAVANFTVTPAGGSTLPTTFAAANNAARSDIEKLANISTRSQTGTGANALIAGFVITGDQAKPVLVRAIGPSLAGFNVAGALSAAHLEVFADTRLLAQGDDWGAAANAGAIAATAVRLNAFPLATNSHDAALLLNLAPGAYTAVASGPGDATGVSLVEVYDASVAPVPASQRIINIATRGVAGSGDRTLIAGFVINGQVPKRVLVRGVGPTLGSFGVGGVLAHPQVAVYSGATVLAQNAGWSRAAESAQIAAAARQVGAFALPAGSDDAALIVNLPPGAYSVQVSGAGTETGVALVEVYEVP